MLAEELGYRRAWIFDSAPRWEDPFVQLGLVAVRTTLHFNTLEKATLMGLSKQ